MSGLSHGYYVAFAYAAAFLVVAGLIIGVWLDYRAQKRALSQLEARGVRRRGSAGPLPAAAAIVRAEAAQ